LSPQPTGEDLKAIWGSGREVWAVGDAGTIVRSSDQGVIWTLVDSGSARDLRAIWGSSAHDLWAVGDVGTVLHSGNGGLRWLPMNAVASGDLRGVWGSGPNDVYIAASDGQLLRTRDGGTSFQIQRPLGPTDEQFTGVWGSGPDDVYVSGDRGSLLASTDGGEHWIARRIQTPRPPQGSFWDTVPKNVRSISGSSTRWIMGAGRGVLLLVDFAWIHTDKGSSTSNVALRSQDGGRTFHSVRIEPTESQWPRYDAVFAADGQTIYGVAKFEREQTGLIVSRNGGVSFEQLSPLTKRATLHALWRGPKGALIAVGAGGTILRSLDDGRSFQEHSKHPFGETTLRAMWTDGAREVWAVGPPCTVLHSSNGGGTFERQQSCHIDEHGKFEPVWGSGADDIYVGGSVIYHTDARRWPGKSSVAHHRSLHR